MWEVCAADSKRYEFKQEDREYQQKFVRCQGLTPILASEERRSDEIETSIVWFSAMSGFADYGDWLRADEGC